jgi:hypothetical protein
VLLTSWKNFVIRLIDQIASSIHQVAPRLHFWQIHRKSKAFHSIIKSHYFGGNFRTTFNIKNLGKHQMEHVGGSLLGEFFMLSIHHIK